MTSLIEGAKRLLSRGSDVGARVAGLEEAVEAGRGRLPDTELDRAAGVVARADRRLKLSADHTVVALAGATGSGKSSTFNAITGLDVSAVGVRRPTTSWTTACVWGEEGASAAARLARDRTATPSRTQCHSRGGPRGPVDAGCRAA